MIIYNASCIKVVDGDTVQLMIDCYLHKLGISQFTKLPCRLLRVNTPELNSPDDIQRGLALEAKEFLLRMVWNRAVTIIPKALDPYKRPLVELYLMDGTNINQLIIENGYGVRMTLAKQLAQVKWYDTPQYKSTKMGLLYL